MLPDPDRIYGSPKDERKGDIYTLLSSALEAVEYARRYDSTRLAQTLATYARLLVRDEQYEESSIRAREILELEHQSQHAVEAIITLGICEAYKNQLDEAERQFHKAADLSRKIGYALGLARALQYLTSLVLVVKGKFHLALTLMEEASYLLDEQGNKHWNEHYLTGLIYQIIGDRRHCRQMLDDLVLQVEPGTQLAAAYYFLWARLALDEEEMEQAKEYLRLGLRVVNRSGTMELNLLFRLEHSRYHRMKNEAPVARTWAEDSLHHAQRYNSKYYTGLALIERAQANWHAGDQSAAETDLHEAIEVLKPLGAAYDLTRIRFLRALWYHQSDRPEAQDAWLEAVQHIVRDGYAFILEKEQDTAFPLVAAYMRSKNAQVRSITDGLLRHLANVPPPALRITTLGQFAVWKGRRRLPDNAWTRRKSGELFRYLLLQQNRAAGREVIIESLWPDHESDKPIDLLHQATSTLRHILEPDLPDKFPSRYIKVEGEHIMLLLPPGSIVDFEHFERALPTAIQMRSADRLQEALNLYSGELFPSDRYADWSEEKRQSLAELHQRGMLALAKAYHDQGQYYNAITCCRQILHIDAWNEDAVLIAMQAFAGMQNVPHALQMYQELERTLKAELNIIPRSDLRELAKSLRQR
jgi:DNA-binding SARP family transcriptional activator